MSAKEKWDYHDGTRIAGDRVCGLYKMTKTGYLMRCANGSVAPIETRFEADQEWKAVERFDEWKSVRYERRGEVAQNAKEDGMTAKTTAPTKAQDSIYCLVAAGKPVNYTDSENAALSAVQSLETTLKAIGVSVSYDIVEVPRWGA